MCVNSWEFDSTLTEKERERQSINATFLIVMCALSLCFRFVSFCAKEECILKWMSSLSISKLTYIPKNIFLHAKKTTHLDGQFDGPFFRFLSKLEPHIRLVFHIYSCFSSFILSRCSKKITIIKMLSQRLVAVARKKTNRLKCHQLKRRVYFQFWLLILRMGWVMNMSPKLAWMRFYQLFAHTLKPTMYTSCVPCARYKIDSSW